MELMLATSMELKFSLSPFSLPSERRLMKSDLFLFVLRLLLSLSFFLPFGNIPVKRDENFWLNEPVL